MSRFPNYEGSNSVRYSNALHASYHQEQYKVLDSRATLDERVHVSAAKMEEYHEVVEELSDRSNEALASPDTEESRVVEELSDRSNEALASPETEESRAQDSERDRILSMVFFLITSGLTALDKAVQAAAKLLNILVAKYKGIQGRSDDEETGLIRGFLQDLRKEEYQAAVTTLKLEDLMTQLEAANEAFATKKAARRQARQTRYMQLSTEDLRKLADETLGEIQDLIRASGIIAAVTEGQQDTVTFAEQLINEMNGVIRGFKQTLNQSEAQKKAHKEDESAPTTPPEGEGTETQPVE